MNVSELTNESSSTSVYPYSDLAEGNQELLSILSTTSRKCFVPTRYFVARELVVYADPSVDGTHVTPLRSNCAQIALVRDELVSKSLVNCFLDYSKQASFMTLVAILRGAMIVTDPQWCLTYEVRKHDTHPICHLAREPSGIQRAVANRLLHRPPLFHGMLFYVREIGQSGVRESRSTKRSSNRSKSSASSSQEDITTTAIRLAAGLGRADIKTLVEVGGGKIRKWSPPMLTTQAAATPSTSRGAKRRSTRLRDSNKHATSATLDASINSDATSTSTAAATSANYPYHCNKGRRVNISDAAEDECGDDAGVPSVHVVIVNKSTIDDLDTVAPPGVWFKTTQWLVESVLLFQVVLDE